MKYALLFLATLFMIFSSAAFSAQDRGAAGLYDLSVHKEARSLAREGRLEEALGKFKEMLRTDEKELWTTQALLVCDEKDLESKAESLEEVTAEPLIIIKRVIDTKTCFRVCAGLFRSRQEAATLGQQLPSPFKEAKPYPLLLVSKGAFAKGAFDLAAPAAAPGNLPEPQAPVRVAEPAPATAKSQMHEAESIPSVTDAAQDLFNKGIESFNRNDLENAESLFKRSIALAPERFEAYNNLGAVLLHEKKYTEAKDVLEKAVILQPGYPNAHSNLGGAYWFLGRRQEAIGEAQKAFRLDSHNVRYCNNLASFLYEEKRYSDAQIYLNVVKIIDPSNEDTLAIQKKIDQALGKTEEPAFTIVDEKPGPDGDKAKDQGASGMTDRVDKKNGADDHGEETAKQDEDGGKDKPKKKFWDRFRKQKPQEDGGDDKKSEE